MKDEFLALFEAAKALVTYIDKEYVFDKAAAGGCSGLDFHQSDTFYDLIVNTRKAVNEFENGLKASYTNSEKNIQMQEGCSRLFEASKAMATHIDKERVFDKINDMGPVGVDTFQSDAFIEVIQKVNKAAEEVEKGV
ncbi:MAG: hypothetical protein V3S16_07445 [Candidatus Desulfatibia sp.]|jgi:hypothetical protein|uniref:hypothetical protein n=1 Tax=Candidatus Desulfatibia sp. TaxID=3101189 RepID=UPI002F33AFA3